MLLWKKFFEKLDWTLNHLKNNYIHSSIQNESLYLLTAHSCIVPVICEHFSRQGWKYVKYQEWYENYNYLEYIVGVLRGVYILFLTYKYLCETSTYHWAHPPCLLIENGVKLLSVSTSIYLLMYYLLTFNFGMKVLYSIVTLYT